MNQERHGQVDSLHDILPVQETYWVLRNGPDYCKMGKPGLQDGYLVFPDRDSAEAFRLDIGHDTTINNSPVEIGIAKLTELFLKGNLCYRTGPLSYAVVTPDIKKRKSHEDEQGRSDLPITEPCPMGWVRAITQDQDGQIQEKWVNPGKLAGAKGAGVRRSQLSDEQKERIRKVRWQLKEHDEQTYEEWIRNFEGDMTPERELRIWEALARTYMAETSQRLHTKKERRQLFGVLLTSTMCGSPEAVVSSQPCLKSYKRLHEVFERFRGYLAETWTPDDERQYKERLPERIDNLTKAGDGQHRFGSSLT